MTILLKERSRARLRVLIRSHTRKANSPTEFKIWQGQEMINKYATATKPTTRFRRQWFARAEAV